MEYFIKQILELLMNRIIENITMDFWNMMAVFSSIIVAGFTAWVAFETRQLSKLTYKALELERMPILGFEDLTFKWNYILVKDLQKDSRSKEIKKASLLQFGIKLKNASRVVVNYRVKEIRFEFPKKIVVRQKAKMLSNQGRVLPGGINVFYDVGYNFDTPFDSFPLKVIGHFHVEYSDELDLNTRNIQESLQITISRNGDRLVLDWLNID